MTSDKIIIVNVVLKRHIRPSYQLVFSSEEKVEQFVDSINNDVDYIIVADEVIERRRIKKLVIKNA